MPRAILLGDRDPYWLPPLCGSATNVVGFAPAPYYAWLAENKAAPRLRDLLDRHLNERVVEVTPDYKPEVSLAPLLDVLRKFANSSARGKRELKAEIFPPEADAVWMAAYETDKAASETDEKAKALFDAARIHPADAPKYSTRANLFTLMTDLETITKRLATELVFDLCDDVAEFTLRSGFGNAIAFLQIRKLMPIPGQKP